MDLAGALAVAGTTARMPVPGNAEDLLKQVLGSQAQAVPQGKVLSLAYHPPGVFLRPVEALHLLSLVTAHAYSADDLHDAYAWWGLLRYLGFFDHEAGTQAHPTLRVSHAGAQVAGVQRRVASEELGIAFGVLLASMRVRNELGPGVPVGSPASMSCCAVLAPDLPAARITTWWPALTEPCRAAWRISWSARGRTTRESGASS